jgi:acyl-CoA thioesterase FadM
VSAAAFVVEQQVRPRHCDAQAVVHAGRYHEFCEDAFVGWLEHVGMSYQALRADGVDLVISESRYSYAGPLGWTTASGSPSPAGQTVSPVSPPPSRSDAARTS